MEDMELESGLADDVDMSISDSYFGEPPEAYVLKSGSTEPWLYLDLDGSELPQPITQGYSCGTGWEIGKGGKELTSKTNPNKHRFNMNSRAGSLVNRMFETVGQGNKKVGQEFFLARKHYMTEAAFYPGLSFHMKRESLPIPGGGTSDSMLPSAFLGEGASVATASTAAAVSDEALVALKALAKGKDETELKQAIIKDEVLGKDSALMVEIFNKGLLGKVLTVGEDGKYE